ncbi:hypothetical protein GIW54_07260 [Pseudomonas proteolytica]|uniref:Uncharacterized protein n=2 Tax=Pseudomonas fluorescens group TaxID=136843 RepID=A0AAW5A344_9PSED|nr:MULTISPECIES: hypothetical protein [Pseudomonas]UEL23496.1 hypothetical protein K6106_27970 [Pseudomonas fluorescens]MCF5056975.1 hypothetical protein [Pseudomonas proteolytica]MCF5100561.1 hypothetical protein [Pseudomonas proteolytica]MQT57023.1 hypothetical protein [Pseudomonas sp. FSL R10-0399]NNA97564.1 hypothetical protein [Pseudomonas gessardii]
MNSLKLLLIDAEGLGSLPAEQLDSISLAANDLGMTISHGISAIGVLLACAATDDDKLSADTLVDIGCLLQSLGNLSSRAANIEVRAENHSRHRDTKKGA